MERGAVMEFKKNDVLTAEAVDYTFDGLGVVRHKGLCFFVKDLLKGENVCMASLFWWEVFCWIVF